MTHGDGGKGSSQRPTNHESFSKHFEEIFGKKPDPIVQDALRRQEIDAKNLSSYPAGFKQRTSCSRCGKVFFLAKDDLHIHTCTPKEPA